MIKEGDILVYKKYKLNTSENNSVSTFFPNSDRIGKK